MKMWILPLVGYLGSVVGFCFMTLAIGTLRVAGAAQKRFCKMRTVAMWILYM